MLLATHTETRLFYWKQDSRGWDLIKAMKNKSKSQVWTNSMSTARLFRIYCHTVTLNTRSLHLTSGSCFISHSARVSQLERSLRSSPPSATTTEANDASGFYNNTGFTVSHLSTWCESFNSLCFEWLWKLSKVTKVTVWPHVPLEQAHITPEVSKGEKKTPSSPRVILINSPILIKHWLAAN